MSDEAEILAIQKLKARYFRFMDTKAWTDWRGLFTDDMTFFRNDDTEPISTSADEFVASVSGVLATAVTIHQGHMPEIELTGESTAEGIWAMFDWVDNRDRGRAIQGFGHYHEKYLKGEDGKWRIKQMRLTRIRVDRQNTTHPAVIEEGRRTWYQPGR